MEKVKVSKEFEEQVLYCKNGRTLFGALDRHHDKYGALDSIEQLQFAKVYMGEYEVLETPEQQLAGYYRRLKKSSNKDEKNMALSVRHTLSLLKMKIPGINVEGENTEVTHDK